MKAFAKTLAIFASLSFAGYNSFSQPMAPKHITANKNPRKNIFDNISSNKGNSKFISVLQAAGLADTLKTQGPFTVFAPTDAAFIKLPTGSLNVLMKPENKAILSNILSYHVLNGKLPLETIESSIAKNGGTFKAKTIQGGELTFTSKGKSLFVTDEKGGISKLLIKNLEQTNGLIYQVESVLMPGK